MVCNIILSSIQSSMIEIILLNLVVKATEGRNIEMVLQAPGKPKSTDK